LKKLLLVFLLLLFAPIAASAARYFWIGDAHGNWQTADRSSAGLLAVANAHPQALVRVYAARTVRWRGIFAVHTWIVVKEKDARAYSRYRAQASGPGTLRARCGAVNQLFPRLTTGRIAYTLAPHRADGPFAVYSSQMLGNARPWVLGAAAILSEASHLAAPQWPSPF